MKEIPNKIEVPSQVISRYIGFEKRVKQVLEGAVPDPVKEAYEQYRPVIEEIYGQNTLHTDLVFHGTGAFQYKKEGGQTDFSEVVPVLGDILRKGIQPQHDAWVRAPGNLPSASVASARFYAKWYANRYQGEDNGMEWEFGDTGDWGAFFGLDTMKAENPLYTAAFSYKMISTNNLKQAGHKYLQQWIGSVRNDITSGTRVMDIGKGHSTIPENFGAIIGMKKSSVRLLHMPVIRKYEGRVVEPILPEQFVVVEIPLKALEAMEEIYPRDQRGNVVVLPMECVDYHLSQYPIAALTQRLQEEEKKEGQEQKRDFSPEDFAMVSKQEVEEASSGIFPDSYFPDNIIRTLQESPLLQDRFADIVNWEGYDLHFHTLSAMAQFEKYFGQVQLPGGVRKEFFRVFLALHDIGKGIEKSGKTQPGYNEQLAVSVLTTLGYEQKEIAIAKALLSDDPLGYYLKTIGSLTYLSEKNSLVKQIFSSQVVQKKIHRIRKEQAVRIREMAATAQMPAAEFFELLQIFHQVDAGSYTSEGGAVGSLNYLFRFDNENRKMEYAPPYEHLGLQLKDEIIGVDKTHGRKGLEISTANYVRAAGTMAKIGEHITGIPFPEKTFGQWEALIHAIRIGDDRLDHMATSEERVLFTQQVIDYLLSDTSHAQNKDHDLFGALAYLKSLGESLSEEKKKTLFITFRNILKVTDKIRSTEDTKQLSFLTRLEGQLTSRLFLSLLPDEYTKSPHYPRLKKTFLSLGRVANSFDTLIDFAGDYENDEVCIQPTLKNKGVLFMRSSCDAYRAIAALRPSLSLLKQIAPDITGTIQNNSRRDIDV